MPQGIYRLEHEQLGTLEFFIVPVGPTEAADSEARARRCVTRQCSLAAQRIRAQPGLALEQQIDALIGDLVKSEPVIQAPRGLNRSTCIWTGLAAPLTIRS